VAINRRSRFWWWPLCWASLAAVTCGYQFYWSTFPLLSPDWPPGLGTVSDIGYLTGVIYLLNALSLIPLFLSGLFQLGRRRRLMIAWAATAAAGVWLQLALLPFQTNGSVGLSGPATWGWRDLALAAGDLAVGAVLAHIAIRATRTPARQVTDAPAVQP
jgi:hypothetical protein